MPYDEDQIKEYAGRWFLELNREDLVAPFLLQSQGVADYEKTHSFYRFALYIVQRSHTSESSTRLRTMR